MASSLISFIEYHSIYSGFIPRTCGLPKSPKILFLPPFPLSFSWGPKSGSDHFPPEFSKDSLNSSHFLMAASSEFNMVVIGISFLLK